MAFLQSNSLTSRTLLLSASAVLFIGVAACSQAAEAETAEVAPTSESVSDKRVEDRDDHDHDHHDHHDDEEMRQVGSHVHGAANLAIALDGSSLTIELESPYYNLVGFEHAPKTEEQKSSLKLAEAALSDAGSIFRFNEDAGCKPDSAKSIKLMASSGHDHDDHDDHDTHEHDHHDHEDDHHHDDDHAHDGDHTDKDDGHEDHNHKDASLTFNFTCQSPDNLEWVETGLFEAFENLEEIDFVYLGPTTQMSDTLTPSSGRTNLN